MLKENNLPLLVADLDGENIFDFMPPKQFGIVIGNEGNGVRPEISAICDGSIIIPMKGMAESLNAAVAAAIFMYEMSGENE